MPYCTDPIHCRHCNTWNECVACLNEIIEDGVNQIFLKWFFMEVREAKVNA